MLLFFLKYLTPKYMLSSIWSIKISPTFHKATLFTKL